MKYAGFWKRFCAAFIDFIVLIPLTWVPYILTSHSKTWTLLLIVPNTMLYWFYNVYFHGRWGKTIGKMAVKIRVVLIDGKPIQWKNAFLRFSVDMVLGALIIIASVIGLMAIPAAEYSSLSWIEQAERINESAPHWYTWLLHFDTIWVYSELIVLLFNKKKRAIHDFIAGTVVVHEDSLTQNGSTLFSEEAGGK